MTKRRLQLRFLHPKKRNQSDMVYVDEPSSQILLGDETCTTTELADTGTNDSDVDHRSTNFKRHHTYQQRLKRGTHLL